MGTLHSQVAYPFTKSNRERDKIMSEVMLSKLHLSLVNNNENVIIKKDDNSGKPLEVLIHGYYFKLENNFSSNADYLYVYVESDIFEDENNGKKFPELLQVMNSSNYEDHECIFSSSAKSDATLRSDLGLIKDGDDLKNSDGKIIEEFGGNLLNFQTLEEIYCPFYISETSVDDLKNKIWIKIDNNNTILNSFVYYNSEWIPIGAVYK